MMSWSCSHLHCLWRQQHFIFDVPLRMHMRMGQPRCARSSCSSWSAKEMKSITDWFRNHAESYWIIQHPLKSVWWQMIQTYLPVHDSMTPWLLYWAVQRCATLSSSQNDLSQPAIKSGGKLLFRRRSGHLGNQILQKIEAKLREQSVAGESPHLVHG